jgi:aminoglycoside phosphotransferase (APT) family kinase protein
VQRLIAGQFPEWAELPVEPVFPLGTDNANYRLGEDKLVRLPRQEEKIAGLERELEWLPRLAPALPLPIPEPLGRGEPAEGFPFPWSVLSWLVGTNASVELRALDGWVRGGATKLGGHYDVEALLAAWDEALELPPWDGPPTWCHCDLDLRNLLFRDGLPSGVLDWGWAGAGDPASDTSVAWKVLPPETRAAFWEALGAGEAEIARARGWTLMQCAGALSYYTPENNPALYFEAERWLSELLG